MFHAGLPPKSCTVNYQTFYFEKISTHSDLTVTDRDVNEPILTNEKVKFTLITNQKPGIHEGEN